MSNELTYKDAGVDTERAAALVGDIGELRKQTEGSRKLFSAFGLFAAGYDLSDYNNPVILAACDGVGTKIELLLKHDQLEIAGVDLVGMNVNDILTANAMPLMFLDYIGVAQLDETKIKRLIAGMSGALAECDCILAGGETAEMPGVVPDGTIELSGFCVGAAEKEDLLDPSTIQPGDAIIGVPSNGIHANGFSLVRKLLETVSLSDDEMIELLAPTRIYYEQVKALQDAAITPRAMAHITGGGIRENLARVLGDLGAEIRLPEWENPVVQKLLAEITEETALHTFNMGVGYMIIVPEDVAHTALSVAPGTYQIGRVRAEPGIEIQIGGLV